MAEQEGKIEDQVASVDIDKWLKDTKLSDEAVSILKNRKVNIDELIEFDVEDLRQFASELKMDSLSKNRFVKSVTKLQKEQMPNMPETVFLPSMSTNFMPSTPAEHNGIIELFECYNQSSASLNLISSSIHLLSQYENVTKDEIEKQISALIKNLQNKKEETLQQIDGVVNSKKDTLSKQMDEINQYLKLIENGKKSYEKYLGSNMNLAERKEAILNMSLVHSVYSLSTRFCVCMQQMTANEVLKREGVSMSMRTVPKVEFDVNKVKKRFNALCEKLQVSDCDQPKSMDFELYKVNDTEIEIEYALHSDDIAGTRKIQEVELEYALLDKKYSKRISKNMRKRRKGSHRSSDEDEDDSDDSDESKSDNSDIEDNNINIDTDDVDINDLDWKSSKNYKKVKYKKRKKRNRYKLKNLKEGRAYLLRIRARNESGFGAWSRIVSALTPKCEVKFDRFDPRYIAIQKKGKYVRTNTKGSCAYGSVFCSKGFDKGVVTWKIKIISRKHGSTEQVGVVRRIYEGAQCHQKQITNCQGVSSGTGLVNGDIISIKLDFKQGNVIFTKNKMPLKTAAIVKGQKYYPAITACMCTGQIFEVVG